MTALFKRGLHHVSLVNEDEEEQESDTAVLISEDEMTEHAEDSNHEEGLTDLAQDVTTRQWRWKFWKKQRRYIVSHSDERRSSYREVNLCGRKFKLCGINSWRAIFLVLFVFTVAIAVSIIVSKLAVEPPAEPTAETTTQLHEPTTEPPGAIPKQQGTEKQHYLSLPLYSFSCRSCFSRFCCVC